MHDERFTASSTLFLLHAQQEQPQARLLLADVAKQVIDGCKHLLVMARFVGKALQPQSGTRPLLAGFTQIDDRLAKGVGNHCGGAFPKAMIRLIVVTVGAQLEGEGE